MADAYFRTSDKYWEDVRAKLPDLIKQIPTKEILPYLTCLSDSDMEKYTKQLERESEEHVNTDLLIKLSKCQNWFIHLKEALSKLGRYQIIDLLNWWDMEDGGSDRRTSASNHPTVSPSFNQRRGNEDRYFSNNGRGRGAVGFTNESPYNPTRNSDVNPNGYRRPRDEQKIGATQRNSRTENRNDSDNVPEINSCVNKSQTTRNSEHVDIHDRTPSLEIRRTNGSGDFNYQENLNDLSSPNIQVSHDTAVSNNRLNNFNVAPESPPSQADNITDSNCSVDNKLVTPRTDVEIQRQKLDSYSKQNKIQKSIQNSSVELRTTNPVDNLPINNNQNSDNGSVQTGTDLSRDNISLEKSGYVKELVRSAIKNPELIHNSKGNRQEDNKNSQISDNGAVEMSTDVSRDNTNFDKSGYVKELVKSGLRNPELIHDSKGDRQREDNCFQTRGQCSVVDTEDKKKNINSDWLIQQITEELKQQHDAYPEHEEKPFLNPDSEITDPIPENNTNQSQLSLDKDNSGDTRENVSSPTTTRNTACPPPKANLQHRDIQEIPNNPNNTSCVGRNGNGGHFTSFAPGTVDSTRDALNTSSTIDLQNEPSREVALFHKNQELPNNYIDAINRGMNNVAQPSSTAHSINTSSYASTIDLLNGPRSKVVGSPIQTNTPTTQLEIPPRNEVDVSQTTANNNDVSFTTRVAIHRAMYDSEMFSTLGFPNSLSSNLVKTSSSSQDTNNDTDTFNTSTTTDIQDDREVINRRLYGTGVSFATVESQIASNSAEIPNDTNTDDYSSRISASTTSTVDPTGLSERGRLRNELRLSGMADGGTDDSPTFSCIVDEHDSTATDFSRNRVVSNYQALGNDPIISGLSTTSTVEPTGLSRRGRLGMEIRITDIADGQNGDDDRIRENESTTHSNLFGDEQSKETSASEANAPVLSSEYRMNFEVRENTDVSSATVDSQTASNFAKILYDTNTNDLSSRESTSTSSTVDPTGVSERGRIRNEHRIFGMADATDFSRNRGVSNSQTLENDVNISGPSTTSTMDPTGFSRMGRLGYEIRIADGPNGDAVRIGDNESTPYSNTFGDEQSNGTSEMAANASILSREFRKNFEGGENRGTTFDWVQSSHPSESLSLASRVGSSPFNFEVIENSETTSLLVSSDDRQGFNQEDEEINETFSTQEDQSLNVPEAGWLSSMNLFPSLSEVIYYALDR
ncbi:hypothetical protein SNE40_008133 [Patella caerulea]|uniref:Caspase recruitment domain-containing protein n=1 Tax=Patella caerulea TaxID=87958 RepID=A0AAN8PYF9_PATCE